VLTKALGDDKAGAIIDRILQGSDTSGIEGLKWMDSAAVAELIKNEHPQIIATILVHLDRDQASEIVACFTNVCATTCCCASPRSTASSRPRCANSTTC
jgi:flagellar motor switch protein FliG